MIPTSANPLSTASFTDFQYSDGSQWIDSSLTDFPLPNPMRWHSNDTNPENWIKHAIILDITDGSEKWIESYHSYYQDGWLRIRPSSYPQYTRVIGSIRHKGRVIAQTINEFVEEDEWLLRQ